MSNTKVFMTSDVVIDDVKVASFSASINMETFQVQIAERHHDEDVYENVRDTVRENRAEFENMAYAVKNNLKAMRG